MTGFAKTHIFECTCFKDAYLPNAMHYLNETRVLRVCTRGAAAAMTRKCSHSAILQEDTEPSSQKFRSLGDFPKMAVLQRCLSQKQRELQTSSMEFLQLKVGTCTVPGIIHASLMAVKT